MKKLSKDEIDKHILRMYRRKVIQRRMNTGRDFRWTIRFKDGFGVALEYQFFKKVSIINVFHKETPYLLRYEQRLNVQKIKNMERRLKLKSILE